MKKLVLGLAMLGLLTSSAHAKQVTTCMSYLVGSFLVTLVEQVSLL